MPCEFPFDGGFGVVGALVPSRGFCGELFEGREPSLAEALPAEESDFDLGQIEPASVLWWVVGREPDPQPASICFAEPVRSRLAGVGREVVEHQVDGVCGGVGGGDVEREFGDVGRRAGRGELGEVASHLWFDGAEHVRCPAPFALVVAAGGVAGADRPARSRIGMQDHR